MKCELCPVYFNANYRYAVETDLEHSFDFNPYYMLGVVSEIRSWLSENNLIPGEHPDDYIWYFKNIEDAMLFVLRWT
jgi:hypothetical protein